MLLDRLGFASQTVDVVLDRLRFSGRTATPPGHEPAGVHGLHEGWWIEHSLAALAPSQTLMLTDAFVGGQGALRNQGGGYGEAGSSGGVGPGGGMPRRPVSMSTGNLVDLYESAAAERGGAGGSMAGLRGVASSSNLWDQQVTRPSLRCVWWWGHGL